MSAGRRDDGSGRLKVLVVAYACNPTQGSEEAVGWQWVQAIARHHDVWVLTAEHHRADIAGADPRSLLAGSPGASA